MKTFNKRGDKGETSLLLGPRVPKSDPHCEAYGTIDEAVAAIGLARALTRRQAIQNMLLDVQKDLFVLAGELATPPEAHERLAQKYPVVTDGDVQRLEGLIDDLEQTVPMPKEFVIPGDSPASAAIHLARAIVRRAERRVVGLQQDGQVSNPEVLRYLNRLADLLFTLGLYEETGSPK
ncbi:MAG: cob(I)yrinic acid a,c-diamide adenosyltransferase [Dehalococcoidia bacterium]|nr:cob(I)yrinic acid a,c-diamide adenosyltransferase [Dehalococcoidia bacterium]